MKYFFGVDSTKVNKLYIYHGNKEKKVHIYGAFIRYLQYNSIEYLKIAYRESEPNIIHFIPKLASDSIEKSRSKYSSKKITYQNNSLLSGSISCRPFIDEFKIPQTKNPDNSYSGHLIRYEIYDFDDDRKAIRFNLNDIEGWAI